MGGPVAKRRHPNFPSDLEGDIFLARKALWLDGFKNHYTPLKFYDWLEANWPGAEKKIKHERLEWIRENARRGAEAVWSYPY
jgi:hypothetical protein